MSTRRCGRSADDHVCVGADGARTTDHHTPLSLHSRLSIFEPHFFGAWHARTHASTVSPIMEGTTRLSLPSSVSDRNLNTLWMDFPSSIKTKSTVRAMELLSEHGI